MLDPATPSDQTREADVGCWVVTEDGDQARFKIGRGQPPADDSVLSWGEPLLRALEQPPLITLIGRRSRYRALFDFEIKKGIGRYRQLERVAQDQTGSPPSVEVRQSILNCIRAGRTVLHRRYIRQEVLDRLGEMLALAIGTYGGVRDASQILGTHPGPVIYVICGIMVYVAARAFMATVEPLSLPHRIVGIAIVLGFAVGGVYAYSRRGSDASAVNDLQLGSVLGVFYAAVVLGGLVTLVWPIASRLPYPGLPIEIVCVLLIDAAITTSQAREDHRKKRGALYAIDTAADAAESSFRRLAPVEDRELREWAADAGRRVAATIRKHKQQVIDPNTEGIDAAARSLINGVVRLARGDWASLMATEPARPRPVPLWRRLLLRLLLSGFLVISALLVPKLVPGLLSASQAETLRVSLFVLAAASLVIPDVGKARDTFLQVLHRS